MLKKIMPTSRASFSCSKQMAKAITKADKELNEEASKQIDILYHAAALALYRYHGWRLERITKLVSISDDTYYDCAESNELSMIQMLYDETGISLMRDDGKQSWYEVMYLNSEIDTGAQMNAYQWLAMRQNQKKWVAAQIVASILIALHRKEGWGAERLGIFFHELEEIKLQYHLDPEEIKAVCELETQFRLRENFELM